MNYYLIDFENVTEKDLLDLDFLLPGDECIFFYSVQCPKLGFNILEFLHEKDVSNRCYNAMVGAKNALDFQLSSYLGYLIGNKKEYERFFIVSHDKGFDNLCAFWADKGVKVERLGYNEKNTGKILKLHEGNSTNKLPYISYEQICGIIPENESPYKLFEIINHYDKKIDIYRALSQHFRNNEKLSLVYKKLKELWKDSKESVKKIS